MGHLIGSVVLLEWWRKIQPHPFGRTTSSATFEVARVTLSRPEPRGYKQPAPWAAPSSWDESGHRLP
jgi:hypothetical protein